MFVHSTQITHQSTASAALSGCWKLDAGRAISLAPAAAGVLRIAHGRVWVTVDVARTGAETPGDLFLVPGRGLVVQAGQRLVLEPSGTDRGAPAYFSWDPLPQAQPVGRAVRAGVWQQSVVCPARDLGRALGQAGAALGRLACGVVALVVPPVRARSTQPGRP